MANHAERLLLCRPLGGLNDVLTQIELACRYGERYGRVVVVDTDEIGANIRDEFSRYFSSLDPNLVLDTRSVRDVLDRLTVAPSFLFGRVTNYSVTYDDAAGNFADNVSKKLVTFDFSRDHTEQLLVHHQCGGLVDAIHALSRLRLRAPLIEMLRERLRLIGPNYIGIHVRNTDLKTGYREKMAQVWLNPADRVFIATDSFDCVQFCRQLFGSERVFSFSDLPGGVLGLHYIDDRASAWRRNVDAVLDLVMLGLSDRYYMFKLEPNHIGAEYSGYSILAANLRNNQHVLAHLIGGQGTDIATAIASLGR